MMVERMIREGKLGKFEMILGESFRKMFKVESKKIEELHDFYIDYFKELFEIEMCRRTNNDIDNAVIIDDIEDDEIPETEEETMQKSW